MAVYIQTVADQRQFEEEPRSPNIPSLDPSEARSQAIQLRAVARKRNTFGKGLGDILLQEGQTVPALVRASVRQALLENGFAVLDAQPDVSTKPQIVEVQINKFWSWMNPGFWAITLSTEIDTDITLKRETGEEKVSVYVKAADQFQTGVDDNWVAVMNSGVKAYIAEIRKKIR